jgi:hypothetical protein
LTTVSDGSELAIPNFALHPLSLVPIAAVEEEGKSMKLRILHAEDFLLLKALGLEPGRALANAKPSPEQLKARRDEQLRYIVAHCSRSEGSATSPASRTAAAR